MPTLYIDRKHTEFKLESKTLVVYIQQQRQRSLPLHLLEHIVIAIDMPLQSRLLTKLASHGISVQFITPRRPRQTASLYGKLGKNTQIRLLQYQAYSSQSHKRQLARLIVRSKIRNHIRLYLYVQRQRPDLHLSTHKALQQLRQAWQQTHDSQRALDSLRGIEGSAAKAGFAAYQRLFPESLGFDGRKRRPPPDPVNACLSLAFTLLHNRAAQQAYAAGFDPMLGFLHEPFYSRESLAADLIETWRPALERWVWRLFRKRYLQQEDFSIAEGICLLNKSGRAKFYAAFERRHKPLLRAIRRQLQWLKQYLQDEVTLP